MKNLFAVSALALVLGAVSAPAMAQQANNAGGFTGPSQAAVTVAEALKLSDDTPVVLVGHIEQSLGGEKYLFSDKTGSLTIEIDNDDWRGVSVNEKDTVEIRGEVDKGFTSFEIEVDSVIKK